MFVGSREEGELYNLYNWRLLSRGGKGDGDCIIQDIALHYFSVFSVALWYAWCLFPRPKSLIVSIDDRLPNLC